jgi:lipopolysaccharide/colanic/teichoic acid biosynthesis glycosyltransferase
MVRLTTEELASPQREPLAASAYVLAPAHTIAPETNARREPRTRIFYRRYAKRLLDIVLGSLLLLAFSPVIIAAAVAVLVTSGWPVFYCARRIGRNGRPFRMIKLRSMRRDAEKLLARWLENDPSLRASFQQSFKLDVDPRTTKVGRFLRRTSIDELPQLLNVVHGDMSLVGPRPIVVEELDNYGDFAGRFLSMRPGVTGLWQVSGRNEITYPERARLELQYVSSASLAFDLRLLALTAFTLLRLDGR